MLLINEYLRTLVSFYFFLLISSTMENKYGMDFGGTLIKLVYFGSVFTEANSLKLDDSTFIHFKIFKSISFRDVLSFIVNDAKDKHISSITISATGGGSEKHKQDIIGFITDEGISVELKQVDEMASLDSGVSFLMKKNIENFRNLTGNAKILYANIGTGVSILSIQPFNPNGKSKRVGGTGIGGGTFYGLSQLFCKIIGIQPMEFDEAVSSATYEDEPKLHLTVGDIYGKDYQPGILNADLIAGFFSACPSLSVMPSIHVINGGLIKMVSYAIVASVSELAHSEHPDLIVFGGSFVSGQSKAIFNYSIILLGKIKEFMEWVLDFKQVKVNHYFLDHDAFVGCLGAIFPKQSN